MHSKAAIKKAQEFLGSLVKIPTNQKFLPGERVRIAKDLGNSMSHFPGAGTIATVVGTYAQQCGGSNVKDYTLIIEGRGQISWYHEHQLSRINRNTNIKR